MTFKRFSTILSVVVLLGTFSTNANALSYTISGSVTNVSGLLASLAPAGSMIIGDLEFSTAPGGTVFAGDVVLIDSQLSPDLATVPGFCFTTLTAPGCPDAQNYPDGMGGETGPSYVGVTSILGSTGITLDGTGNPISGTLDFIALSTAFGLNNILISFDFGTGTFSADGNQDGNPLPLGIASGTFTTEAAVVPVPAAAWLLGSALLGLMGMRRRS